jgi:hypothetical protein
MRSIAALCVVIVAALLASGAARAQNPTTPGAIPDPGSYQGSLELQRRQDEQDRQWRQQQEQPAPQYAPQPGYGAPSSPQRGGAAPALPKVMPDFAASDRAIAAMSRGDYATANRILKPLVARGDMSAQYLAGVMNERGMGAPPNYAVARQLFLKSAMQGWPAAMMNLGGLHAQGEGGAVDNVQAYRWFTLAIPRLRDNPDLRKDAVDYRNSLVRKMTRAQIAQAESLARQTPAPTF